MGAMAVTHVALFENYSPLVKKPNVHQREKKIKSAFNLDQTSELKNFPGVNTPFLTAFKCPCLNFHSRKT